MRGVSMNFVGKLLKLKEYVHRVPIYRQAEVEMIVYHICLRFEMGGEQPYV